ncbi:hypothetical protein Hte_007717 [Hypoxylon texense]
MAINFLNRWNSYRGPIAPLRYAVWALYVTWWDAIRSRGLAAIAGTAKWRDEAFVLWFRTLSPHFIRMESSTVVPELVASADGIVLELGPGLGNQIPSFDKTKIDHIYGVEINGSFVPDLQAKAVACGLEGKYTVINCGVEDTDVLEKHGIKAGSIDSIVSMQVFCSAPQPEAVAKEMYRLLKPGGKFIFWEHRRSDDFVTRTVQYLWNFPWSFLARCNLNRDLAPIIRAAGPWKNIESMDEKSQPWEMLPRVWATMITGERRKSFGIGGAGNIRTRDEAWVHDMISAKDAVKRRKSSTSAESRESKSSTFSWRLKSLFGSSRTNSIPEATK